MQAAMRAEDAFVNYVSAVADKDRPPLDILWIAIIAVWDRTEQVAPAMHEVQRFVDSPAGSGMSDADRDFLKRYLGQLVAQITARRRETTAWASTLTFPRGVTPQLLRQAAMDLPPAWTALERLDDGTVERLLARTAERIGDPAETAKWKRALVRLPDHRPEFPSDRASELRRDAVLSVMDDLFKERADLSQQRAAQKEFMTEILMYLIVFPENTSHSLVLERTRMSEIIRPQRQALLRDKIQAAARKLWLAELR
ncbi:MAG: hypothetical protein J0H01_10690 [Rhizobiales bacterium]|nr:hypothetical protein [Hyphomicrobiales bacterium]